MTDLHTTQQGKQDCSGTWNTTVSVINETWISYHSELFQFPTSNHCICTDACVQEALNASRESWTCSASAEAPVCLSAVPEMTSHEVKTSGPGGNFVCISYLWVSGRSSLQGIQEDVCVTASARCVFVWMCIQVSKEAAQNTSANIWVHRLCLVFQQVGEINTKNTHRLRTARGKSCSNPRPPQTHTLTHPHTLQNLPMAPVPGSVTS